MFGCEAKAMSLASFTMLCGLWAYSWLVVDDLMAIHCIGLGGSAWACLACDASSGRLTALAQKSLMVIVLG